jgi:hypothetical protein
MDKKEKIEIISRCIEFVWDVDNDKPEGEFFANFHNENVYLLKDLRRLKRSIKWGM